MNKISFINLYCLEDEFVRTRIKEDNDLIDSLTLTKLYLTTASSFKLINEGLWAVENSENIVIDNNAFIVSHGKDKIRSQKIMNSFENLIFKKFDQFSKIFNRFNHHFANL